MTLQEDGGLAFEMIFGNKNYCETWKLAISYSIDYRTFFARVQKNKLCLYFNNKHLALKAQTQAPEPFLWVLKIEKIWKYFKYFFDKNLIIQILIAEFVKKIYVSVLVRLRFYKIKVIIILLYFIRLHNFFSF
jgi:hypothetical protein